MPTRLRARLLRAVVSPDAITPSLRATLRSVGLSEDPAQAVAALLRSEGPASSAPQLLRRYLREAGLGEWTPAGFLPTAAERAPPPEGGPGSRPGAASYAWAPGGARGARTDDLRAPALLSRLLARSGWSDDVVGAQGFVPVIVAGQVRFIRPPDDVADPTLPQLDRSADAPLWPDAAASSHAAAAQGVPDPTAAPGGPSNDDAWIRQAMRRAGVAQPALLLPPALRAAFGGNAVPASVIRSVLGMSPGGGKPVSIAALVDLLGPMGKARSKLGTAAGWGAARIGPVSPAEAAAVGERARLEALADRLGDTLAGLARRTSSADGWPAGVLRLKGPGDPLGELLSRVDSGDRALWKRIVTAMGPAATATLVQGEELTPELLRAVLQEERELPAVGPGELIGGERARARGLRDEAAEQTHSTERRKDQLKERAERHHREQRERVTQERARQIEEAHAASEPLGERTLSLVRSLFPKSVGRLGHAVRRSAFPGSLPGGDEPDLMLVAPTTEIIRREAAPLFKENPQADEVRAGASQAPTQQRGDDPARVEKFLSPEKIEEFARRSFDLLIDEIALDAERQGLDPHGYD